MRLMNLHEYGSNEWECGCDMIVVIILCVNDINSVYVVDEVMRNCVTYNESVFAVEIVSSVVNLCSLPKLCCL
jgi:hypothetical protein